MLPTRDQVSSSKNDKRIWAICVPRSHLFNKHPHSHSRNDAPRFEGTTYCWVPHYLSHFTSHALTQPIVYKTGFIVQECPSPYAAWAAPKIHCCQSLYPWFLIHHCVCVSHHKGVPSIPHTLSNRCHKFCRECPQFPVSLYNVKIRLRW